MFVRSIRSVMPAVFAACASLGAVVPAYAGLGAAPMQTPAGATVNKSAAATAHAAASGTSSSATTTSSYTLKQTTLASGTVVREYIDQNGTVFGIAWDGPIMPDLPTLLGSYFPQFASSVKTMREQRRGRGGPVSIDMSGLVVHSGGHMGHYSGQAWLPEALPSGVTGDDIQ